MPRGIDFGAEESPVLLRGWYGLQGNPPRCYRWTAQEFSLFVPPATSAIEICAMVPPFETAEFPVTLTVSAEESLLGSINLPDAEWRTFVVPFSRPTLNVTKATLRLSRSYCPRDRGNGEDARTLGLAVSRIGFLS